MVVDELSAAEKQIRVNELHGNVVVGLRGAGDVTERKIMRH
jgi:hypothetical protein